MIDFDQIAALTGTMATAARASDKHDVSQAEAESIFFNDPLIVAEDAKHSSRERRFNALGKTAQGRLLHVTFTLRENGTLLRRDFGARHAPKREEGL